MLEKTKSGNVTDALNYQGGFLNTFESEALPGALPVGRNSPQRAPYGLYAEQLSGTAFTAPRVNNRRTWFYRIRPSVKHGTKFQRVDRGLIRSAPCHEVDDVPFAQLRWHPISVPKEPLDFLSGLRTITTCGDNQMQSGIASHVYLANRSMNRKYFYNADGELLIVPQDGAIRVLTECGILEIEPGEICIVPRGMKFRVDLLAEIARGFVCENYGNFFVLPERGPIGANCLANSRDFLSPAAFYEDDDAACELFVKARGAMYRTELKSSPLDVVAWHGNYAPCKYDLRRFSPVGSVLFDHPDPSIYTVLTSTSETPGTANVDFVIFPERWLVMENSFRPPWYHMNAMSEFMGLIYGVYDAKPEGFRPGGMSLHNAFVPHGPDAEAFERASKADLKPQKLSNTLAFMFETRFAQLPTKYALSEPLLDDEYDSAWEPLKKNFDAARHDW